MHKQASIRMETHLDRDGVLVVTGLPFRAGDHLIVEIEPAATNGPRRFPMRGRPYDFVDPLEPVLRPEAWESEQ